MFVFFFIISEINIKFNKYLLLRRGRYDIIYRRDNYFFFKISKETMK